MKSGPKPRPSVAVVTRQSAFFTRYSVEFTDPKGRDRRTVIATVYEDKSPTLLQHPVRGRICKLREDRHSVILPIVEEAIKNAMATSVL